MDKLEDYIKNAAKICEEASKRRIEEQSLNYQSLLTHIDPSLKPFAQKVVDFKLRSAAEINEVFKETEVYLAKAHKAFINSPSVRDELYRAIGGWTLAVKQSSTLKQRFETELRKILNTIYPTNDDGNFWILQVNTPT